MKKFSLTSFAEEFCRVTKKWCVFLSFDISNTEITKAAPYLNWNEDAQLISDENGFIICDSEEEAYDVFYQTVGDDGPTEKNPYNGITRIYALVIGPDDMETENT